MITQKGKKMAKQSIEPKIADLANSWLKKYQLDYKLEQETLNDEIDKALKDYFSKLSEWRKLFRIDKTYL